MLLTKKFSGSWELGYSVHKTGYKVLLYIPSIKIKLNMNELTKWVLFITKLWELKNWSKLQSYMLFSVIDHSLNHNGQRQACIYASLFHKPFHNTGRKWGMSTVWQQWSLRKSPNMSKTKPSLHRSLCQCFITHYLRCGSGFLPENEKWVTAGGKAGGQSSHRVTAASVVLVGVELASEGAVEGGGGLGSECSARSACFLEPWNVQTCIRLIDELFSYLTM